MGYQISAEDNNRQGMEAYCQADRLVAEHKKLGWTAPSESELNYFCTGFEFGFRFAMGEELPDGPKD